MKAKVKRTAFYNIDDNNTVILNQDDVVEVIEGVGTSFTIICDKATFDIVHNDLDKFFEIIGNK